MWSQFINVTDRQTDRQTTCDRNTALCTKVHRAVINHSELWNCRGPPCQRGPRQWKQPATPSLRRWVGPSSACPDLLLPRWYAYYFSATESAEMHSNIAGAPRCVIAVVKSRQRHGMEVSGFRTLCPLYSGCGRTLGLYCVRGIAWQPWWVYFCFVLLLIFRCVHSAV